VVFLGTFIKGKIGDMVPFKNKKVKKRNYSLGGYFARRHRIPK
jgi:hypothetical protein